MLEYEANTNTYLLLGKNQFGGKNQSYGKVHSQGEFIKKLSQTDVRLRIKLLKDLKDGNVEKSQDIAQRKPDISSTDLENWIE